jgi:nitrogen regulatory protein P-II 2
MHLVVAVLKPSLLEAVREALAAVHVTRLTVCDAQSYEPPLPTAELLQDTVLQIAVNDDFLERTVETIRCTLSAAAPDGAAGLAGRLLVLPMDQAVQIYRDVRGPEAI